MRPIKVILLAAVLVAACFFIYLKAVYPARWHSQTRRESIQILQAARSTAELTNAVGYLGWFVQLTNHQWIAIRYRDTHSGFIGSSAVARDSDGEWFESDRHFCGCFQYWPNLKEQFQAGEEQRHLADSPTNAVSPAEPNSAGFPSYHELLAIEAAPDLENARRALMQIGFRKLAQ